jgi:hypothetical protein
MTAAMKRDRLITYLADADDKKVKALYSLLEEEISEREVAPYFTLEQLEILDERRTSLLSSKNKGTDWQTIHQNIREKRKAS